MIQKCLLLPETHSAHHHSLRVYLRPILKLDTGFLHLLKKSGTQSDESLDDLHIASHRYLASTRAIQATSGSPAVVTAHSGSRTVVGELSHRFPVLMVDTNVLESELSKLHFGATPVRVGGTGVHGFCCEPSSKPKLHR